MRSKEREEKNATEKEGGDEALSEVRGYDAEGRGMFRQVLEVPEQEVPMANVGELERR